MPELPRRQVTAPVRFTDLVLRLGELGVRAVLEVGPGRVLSGLVRRTGQLLTSKDRVPA